MYRLSETLKGFNPILSVEDKLNPRLILSIIRIKLRMRSLEQIMQ